MNDHHLLQLSGTNWREISVASDCVLYVILIHVTPNLFLDGDAIGYAGCSCCPEASRLSSITLVPCIFTAERCTQRQRHGILRVELECYLETNGFFHPHLRQVLRWFSHMYNKHIHAENGLRTAYLRVTQIYLHILFIYIIINGIYLHISIYMYIKHIYVG